MLIEQVSCFEYLVDFKKPAWIESKGIMYRHIEMKMPDYHPRLCQKQYNAARATTGRLKSNWVRKQIEEFMSDPTLHLIVFEHSQYVVRHGMELMSLYERGKVQHLLVLRLQDRKRQYQQMLFRGKKVIVMFGEFSDNPYVLYECLSTAQDIVGCDDLKIVRLHVIGTWDDL